jgi:hypothetical protein
MPNVKSTRGPAPHNLASEFRGIYSRVASRLHVDPSYVSRVARGERKSAKIAAALEEDMWNILKKLKETYSEFGLRRNNRKPRRKIGIAQIRKR